MKKFSGRIEEIILMIAALVILLLCFWNPVVSLIIAVIGAIIVFIYNLITKEKNDISNGEQE